MAYRGGGRGRRHRWMYQITGLPGWIRFGFSPGWVGRSPSGLPPTAEWIMQSGQLPQFQSYLQTLPKAAIDPAKIPQPIASMRPQLTKDQEKQMLESQKRLLEQQLKDIRKRLNEMKEDQ
ncbi:MAG: DUF5320 domain-containing protein [Promethearchaeota archaeon]